MGSSAAPNVPSPPLASCSSIRAELEFRLVCRPQRTRTTTCLFVGSRALQLEGAAEGLLLGV